MATRNSNNKKKNSMVSTRKTFTTNRERFSLSHETSDISKNQKTPSSNTVTKSSLPSPSSSIPNGNNNQPIAQNFSSRNSLRTAKTFSTIPQHNFTMPNIADFNWNDRDNLEKIVSSRQNYDKLSSKYFIRSEQDCLICLLCDKWERKSLDVHLSSELHNRRYYYLKYYLVQQVPDDSSLQMNSIRELLNNWYCLQSLSNEMINSRVSVMQEFHAIMSTIAPDCHCRVLGSMMTETPLISSDINLELIHPNSHIFEADPRSRNSIHHKLINPDAEIGQQINYHSVHFDLIPNAIDTLHELMIVMNDRYKGSFKVISNLNDLNAKVPKLVLRHVLSNTILQVCCYAESSHKLATLLRAYMSLDPRASILSVLVKYWAKICKIDNPDCGTYPPDVYIILVIYYLQRTSPPILPCLHELIHKYSKAAMKHNQSEKVPISDFNKLTIKEGKLKETNANASISNQFRMNEIGTEENNMDNLLDNIEVGTEEEMEEEEEDDDYLTAEMDIIKNLNWKSANDTPIHKLFLNFLLFMSHEFNDKRNVISVRTLREIPLTAKRYVTQVKAIEHPVRPKVNMSCCVGTTRTFDYIKQCFTQGFQYLTCLPVDSHLRPKIKRDGHFDPCDYIDLYVHVHRFKSYYLKMKDSIQSKCKSNPINEMVRQNLFAKDVEVINILFDNMIQIKGDIRELPSQVAKFYNEEFMIPKDFGTTVFCWICKGVGHTRQTCFKAKIESLAEDLESYDINLDLTADLDSYFISLYSQDIITPELSEIHKDIVDQLEKLIITATGLNCRLQLFGSTVNNLGSADSDLDICLTLDGNLTGKGVDCAAVLAKVHSVLIRENQISFVEPILTARVPIIKFKYSRFDVDLSMYNQCAIYNSKLLKAYALIDRRVAQLFYLVKRYAKACKIADASRGSLSSYAWSLLVIHYLQHTSPPILPVLQEVRQDSKRITIGVNGWNVWFDDQYRNSPIPENNMSLTQLFKNFFLYYSNFDFNIHVVSIRKSNILTRFQKNWNNCAMAIEDPFELTYNLASRLDEPMAIYIINSFAYAFKNIVEVQTMLRNQKQSRNSKPVQLGRLFNGRYITNSTPPYRGCRFCHRIGHRWKDCPEKNVGKNNQDTKPWTKTN